MPAHNSLYIVVCCSELSSAILGLANVQTRVSKNTYPVCTKHGLQFSLEYCHMQQVPRLVAGVLHCTCKSVYMHNIEAVVAQELKHSLLV